MFIRRKRYEQDRREAFEKGWNARQDFDEISIDVKRMQQNYAAELERKATAAFVFRMEQTAEGMKQRAAMLKKFSVLRQAQDIIDGHD